MRTLSLATLATRIYLSELFLKIPALKYSSNGPVHGNEKYTKRPSTKDELTD